MREGFSCRIADACLENVPLSPSVFLLILTNLDQYLIRSGFEFDRSDILVDLHAGVVDLVGDDQFPIDPNFLSIDATDSKLASHIAWAGHFCKSVHDASFLVVVEFRKIDQTLWIGTRLLNPLHSTGLTRVAIGDFACDIVGFNWISRVELIAAYIVERPDELP